VRQFGDDEEQEVFEQNVMPTLKEQKAGRTKLHSLVDQYHRRELMRKKVIEQCEELAGCRVELKDETTRKNWIQVIIKEGLESLLKLAGDPSFRVNGPFGLFSDLSISCKGGKYLALRVRLPNGTKCGQFAYEDPRPTPVTFNPGTIGALNGGNSKFRLFPRDFTVAQLIRLVQSRRAFRAFVKASDIVGPGWKKTIPTEKQACKNTKTS